MIHHQKQLFSLACLILIFFSSLFTANAATCKPDCTKFDTCILVLSPMPFDTAIEGDILPIKYVVSRERVTLMDIQISDDSGKTWHGIAEKPFGTKPCTTLIQSVLATQLPFRTDEFLKHCKIRIAAHGEGVPLKESDGFFILKKRVSAILPAKGQLHRNLVQTAQKQNFNLHGQLLQGSAAPVNRLVIARDSEGRVVPVFTLR